MRTSRQRAAGLAVCLAGVLAPADQTTEPSTAPTAPQLIAETFSTEPLTPQWHARLGELVRTNALSALVAGRMYAALSVAQYRAIVAVDNGVGVAGRSRYEAERGAVSGASAVVLGFLFPRATSALEGQVATDATSGKGKTDPSFTRGLAIGRAAGEAMIAHLQNDGSSLPFSGTIPAGPGFWTPAPGAPPGGANLGGVTPYLVNSTSQFRSAPPPAFSTFLPA